MTIEGSSTHGGSVCYVEHPHLPHATLVLGVCLVVLGGGLMGCSDDGDSTDSGASESSDDSLVEHAAEQQGDGSGLFAGYTEDEIGTEILVDEKLASPSHSGSIPHIRRSS